MNYLRIVGIDIAKDKFDVFIIRAVDGCKVTEKSLTIQFNSQGLEEFIGLLEPNDLCVMEATGCYHDRLVRVLHEHNIAQTVVNPKYSYHYTKMLGSITKTDSQDAMRLAEFGRQYSDKLPLFKMPEAQELKTKALYNDLRILKTNLQALKNQLHARELSLMSNHTQNLNDLIKYHEDCIDKLEKELYTIIKAEHKADYDLLIKIPGLGKVCVTAFIMAYRSFIQNGGKANVKAFCKHLGLAPMIFQSGKRKAKSRLGRSADPTLVAALYLGMRSAITTSKKDNPMKTFANRLRERGFSFKKACIATVHKVVRIAWSVLMTQQPYQPDYIPVKPESLVSGKLNQAQNQVNPNKISGAA